MKLDGIDLEIVDCLQEDGRASLVTIGKRAGITGPAVYARIKRMEEGGVIRGYRVDLDHAQLQRPLIAFVRVTTRPIKVETDSFEPYVWAEERIIECHDIAGEDTFIMKVRCSSPKDLRDLLLCVRAQPQVIRTISSVALVVVKEPGLRTPH